MNRLNLALPQRNEPLTADPRAQHGFKVEDHRVRWVDADALGELGEREAAFLPVSRVKPVRHAESCACARLVDELSVFTKFVSRREWVKTVERAQCGAEQRGVAVRCETRVARRFDEPTLETDHGVVIHQACHRDGGE